MEKSALLELESTNQGLLLTRVSDTSNATGIDANNPPDGMIIYFTDANHHGLYIRKDGWWHEMVTKDGEGITSLNGDKTKVQTLTFSTDAGSPIGFLPPVNGAQVLNIPLASSDNTGLITKSDQILGGVKTFLKSLKIDAMTQGSILFVKDDKSLAQDNGNLFWDDTNNKLGIDLGNGIAPGNSLEVNSGITGNGGIRLTQLSPSSIPDASAGAIGVNTNGDIVRVQNGIASLNSLTAQSQALVTGTSGTDFNISSAGSTHTFNMPDASAASRGVITTGIQTIGGWKTFSKSPTIETLKKGALVFVGNDPLDTLSGDESNLFWDQNNGRLGIGTNTPQNTVEIMGATGKAGLTFSNLTSTEGVSDQTAEAIGVSVSGEVVRVNTAPTYYNSNGTILNPQVKKIIVDSITGTSVSEVKTINLPSIGMTKIVGIQLTGRIITSDPDHYPLFSIIPSVLDYNTSQIRIRVLELEIGNDGLLSKTLGTLAGNPFQVPSIGSLNLLGINLGKTDNAQPYTIYYRIEGY